MIVRFFILEHNLLKEEKIENRIFIGINPTDKIEVGGFLTSDGIRNFLVMYGHTEFRGILIVKFRGNPCIFAYGIPYVLHGYTQIPPWN
jgi:hypothetical protein